MNLIDKKIAQRNGIAYSLSPVWEYTILFEPVPVEVERPSVLDDINKITTKVLGKPPKETGIETIDIDKLKVRYNFYYDDPNESEEQRDLFIKQNTKPNDNSYMNYLKTELNKGNRLMYGEQVCKKIDFRLVIIEKKRVNEPRYQYKGR